MVRTQIQITEKQAEKIRRIAKARHLSMAQVIREAVENVVNAEAAVDVQESLRNTPLLRATFESMGRGEVIQVLRAAGADPWCANKSQVSPVLLARTIASYPVAQFYADLAA